MTILFIIFAIITATFLLTVFFGAPFVPSRRTELKKAFSELYPLSPTDTLIDVGSGSGTVLRAAATYKPKRLVGYEINPFLVLISKILCRKLPNTQILCRNFLHTQFPKDTTVVYIFGVDHLIPRLAAKIQESVDRSSRPIYLISYGFRLPNQKPTKTLDALFLYKISPAKPSSQNPQT
ncbi:class I SAM-dependent methyltransferase [Candidatus Saccharibacteria bacterium]|nr:class I SAM-dependent methyltransferase [Candidatus Saccharibacteria bacterium]